MQGLSIEKLVISLFAKGLSVSDIEDVLREIYEIERSTSAISIITNKVTQAAVVWQIGHWIAFHGGLAGWCN